MNPNSRFYLDDHLNIVVTHLKQILSDNSTSQLTMEQLSIKEEPRGAHQEGNRCTACVISQQCHIDSLHEQCGQLDASGGYKVELDPAQALSIH